MTQPAGRTHTQPRRGGTQAPPSLDGAPSVRAALSTRRRRPEYAPFSRNSYICTHRCRVRPRAAHRPSRRSRHGDGPPRWRRRPNPPGSVRTPFRGRSRRGRDVGPERPGEAVGLRLGPAAEGPCSKGAGACAVYWDGARSPQALRTGPVGGRAQGLSASRRHGVTGAEPTPRPHLVRTSRHGLPGLWCGPGCARRRSEGSWWRSSAPA